jgi:cation diffusion facilitator family transporter
MNLQSTGIVSADREKSRVALSSVVAALFLTGFKIVVGIMTGSLGILAEALHSALDLAAAIMTYAAVRIAAIPADDTHPYGHGKVESFSALFETLLLAVTCFWIIYEAIQRLFFKSVEVNPSIWGFAVMIVSIAIDYTRSRALMRAARRYKSQALEADALHFSTDIWSSLVVILGLGLVRYGEKTPYKDLWEHADSVAALGVALIVLWVSFLLGKETMDVLMDKAPKGLISQITEAALSVPGIVACTRVRVRPVGSVPFADIVVRVSRTVSFDQAHAIASLVEEKVRALESKADVVVHIEPMSPASESWQDRIHSIARENGYTVHEVEVHEVDGMRNIVLHLEVSPGLSLAEAHKVADRLEQQIRGQLKGVADVKTHIEPQTNVLLSAEEASEDMPEVQGALREVTADFASLRDIHEISLHRLDSGLHLALHCVFDPNLRIDEVHRLSSQIEERLQKRLPHLKRVHIHTEPPEGS